MQKNVFISCFRFLFHYFSFISLLYLCRLQFPTHAVLFRWTCPIKGINKWMNEWMNEWRMNLILKTKTKSYNAEELQKSFATRDSQWKLDSDFFPSLLWQKQSFRIISMRQLSYVIAISFGGHGRFVAFGPQMGIFAENVIFVKSDDARLVNLHEDWNRCLQIRVPLALVSYLIIFMAKE